MSLEIIMETSGRGFVDSRFHSRITFYFPFWVQITLCPINLASQDHYHGSLKDWESSVPLRIQINSVPRPAAHCLPLTHSASRMSHERQPHMLPQASIESGSDWPVCSPLLSSAPYPLIEQMRMRPRGRTINPSVPEPLAT